MAFDSFVRLEVLEQRRNTCSFHHALIAYHYFSTASDIEMRELSIFSLKIGLCIKALEFQIPILPQVKHKMVGFEVFCVYWSLGPRRDLDWGLHGLGKLCSDHSTNDCLSWFSPLRARYFAFSHQNTFLCQKAPLASERWSPTT